VPRHYYYQVDGELRARGAARAWLARWKLRDPPADAVPRLPSPLAAVDAPDDDEPTAAPIAAASGGGAAPCAAAAAARVAPFRRHERAPSTRRSLAVTRSCEEATFVRLEGVVPPLRFEMLAARADVDMTGGSSEAATPELFLEVSADGGWSGEWRGL